METLDSNGESESIIALFTYLEEKEKKELLPFCPQGQSIRSEISGENVEN